MKWLARELNDAHPLVHPDLRIAGKEILLERMGQMLSATMPVQLVMRQTIEAHLRRMEWSERHIARFFPFISENAGGPDQDAPMVIVIDPRIAYGRPALRSGVRTSIIIERFEAGDTIRELSEDYESSAEEIEEAIRYERVGARYARYQEAA